MPLHVPYFRDALPLLIQERVRYGLFFGQVPNDGLSLPALIDAREKINSLINDWDDATVEAIAADNLFKDISKERRQAALEELKKKVGACRPGARFDVENALRGQWTMTCERGEMNVAITLAPTMPPKVQYWAMMPSIPGTAATCR